VLHRPGFHFPKDVQDHLLKGGVAVMAMSAPAAGSQIHFDIATARRILAYLNHRIAKIRTALKLWNPG